MSKSGFSTLHRWLGRKNKDKSMANGKLSKSNTNLSISSTNINETSQLEYNRITPLPAATTNAPFEQTFRITVLLPKDQLYVTRLGARVPLSKLLELVCDNKLLDKEKYEFRNPVDPSQVYSCDLTIGAVGLCEIRLCHKSESYDNFNSDEIIKLHRTSLIRESLSSSEFSSRNSKHTTKTTSPYSSTNSLNSMDSSAVSCGRANKLQPKLSAPPRKKRAAPRPPSQIAIPEKSPLIMENGEVEKEPKPTAALDSSLATKDFSISTPNLTSSTMLHSDINGNDCNENIEDFNDVSSGNGSLNSHGYGEDTVLYAQVQKKNALNLNIQNKADEQESSKEITSKFPEPSPRKRIVQVKKKTAAPPAPPPRNSMYQEDAVSIASTNGSSHSTPSTPKDSPKSPVENFEPLQQQSHEETKNCSTSMPTPVPRITTSTTTLLNATNIEQDLRHITNDTEQSKTKSNISKVLLNRTPTPEPRSLSCEPSEIEQCFETSLVEFKQEFTEEDCVSKQADSGIGEPVPSPIPDSLSPEVSNMDVKSHFESSSDDDDMVKVFNFKLGKTLVKPASETKTLEELTIINNGQEETDSELSTPLVLTQVHTPNTLSETSSWNFAIPISPPPNFADNLMADPKPDTPITPKIMERPVLIFEDLKQEPQNSQQNKENKTNDKETEKLTPAATTPLDDILHELSCIIQEKGIESIMKKTEKPQEIEAATPNTLSNFSINTLAQSSNTKPKEVLGENASTDTLLTVTDFAKAPSPISSPSSITSTGPEEEKIYRKRSSVTSLKQRKSITRSDSFHTTVAANESLSLNKRTSSQLSLDQMAGNLNRRRSSSELSIRESPSLQSLEVIKTILNSRKNSLPNGPSDEQEQEIEVNARRPSEELKFTSLELKTSKNLEKHEKENYCDDVQRRQEETKPLQSEEKPKELPKIYRYSGPPSINFSTWSERPKSQVAIKNEGDYIFGGAQNNKDTKNYRLSTQAPPTFPKPTPKSDTLQRMGIPEKNYKVPVLVKPLQDVIIEKTPAIQKRPQLNGEIQAVQRPTVESVLRPQTQVIVNNGSSSVPRNIQRTNTVETVLRSQNQNIVNTLPRAHTQRFSTPAGPQFLRSTSTKQPQQSEKLNSNKIKMPGPQLLRSCSIKQHQQQQQEVQNSSTQAPFGQNTLRRTGFKEKILAQEEQEDKEKDTTTITNGGLTLNNQKFNNNAIASAKLHLNLKPTNSSVTAITSQQKSFSPCSSTATIILGTPSLKSQTAVPKTAPVFAAANTTFSFNTPQPPAPPKASSVLQLKSFTQVSTATATDDTDTRNELLAAIRTFNREGLKKA